MGQFTTRRGRLQTASCLQNRVQVHRTSSVARTGGRWDSLPSTTPPYQGARHEDVGLVRCRDLHLYGVCLVRPGNSWVRSALGYEQRTDLRYRSARRNDRGHVVGREVVLI